MCILACSGEHALEVVYVAVWTGFAHARGLGLLCTVSVLLALPERRFIPPVVLVSLLGIHPAWTIDAFHGDCGNTKVAASWLFTGVGVAVVVWQMVRRERHFYSLRKARATAAPT